ncbi:Flp pilus assembly protein CpaB [Arthrobacter crystallopoietes]|uniref:Flp pilus assembly protein CpaB n=1 Tax=Crystallibacter crystallopoietes TaxID=37928 RepID=UPI0011111455|nr:Flp pilus assembly protein CpaB [Arthrobacter crystallopoietes]
MKKRIIGAVSALLMAITGTVMVLSYVNGADERALAGAKTVNVLVMSKNVAGGTPAEQLGEFVTQQQVPAKVVPSGAVSDLEELAGQVAAVDLVAGEQILVGRFAKPADLESAGAVSVPKGMQEVTISLEPPRVVGGKLQAGDTVGIFMSLEEGPKEQGPISHLTLHKVLVTDVQGLAVPAEESGDASAPVPANNVLVTFAVSAADAERIIYGQEFGRIWLSKEPETADEKGTRILDKEGLYR